MMVVVVVFRERERDVVCLQKLKNTLFYRLRRFGLPLLLQMFADVVRRLQTFYL
ncbi:hypothetical protein Hdeb2414_s0005g00172541 [Helianthus debilis subsp. tardiflorus]